VPAYTTPIHSVEGGWHGIRGGWGEIEGPSLAWREEEHGGAEVRLEERRSMSEVDVRGAVRLEQHAATCPASAQQPRRHGCMTWKTWMQSFKVQGCHS
jgi:hypothetical protein